MNDNHSPPLAAALEAVRHMPAFTEAGRNCIRVAVRDTTASAGDQRQPFGLLDCVIAGVISLALVWFVIGPAWVGAIDLVARLCQ